MDGFFVCKLRKFSNKIGPSQPVAVKTSANAVATGSNAPSGASQRAKEARKEKSPKPYLAPRAANQSVEAEAAPAGSSKKRRRDNGK